MKRLFPVVYFFSLLVAGYCFGGSATWSANPVSGDWNTAANWTPATVPNGPFETATFNISTITSISLSGRIRVAGIVFNAGASQFTITCPQQLIFVGAGITNNSGVIQNFISNKVLVPIQFNNSASAGNGTAFTNNGGLIEFDDSSTAASATFTTISFGLTTFNNDSTCATALFVTQDGGMTTPSNGANATFITNAGGTTNLFADDRANNATLIANSGGTIACHIFSYGDTARVEIFDGGLLSLNDSEIQFGSIEGDGTIETGNTPITVGTNNLSTAFGGLIQDTNASLDGATIIKVGTGTFRLSSANTYRNGTVVSSGTLIVANTSGSATGVGNVSVEGGTLGGKGIIAGSTTVGTGSGTGAFLQPGKGASTATTLTIQNTLSFKSDGTYTWKLNTKKAKTDQVIANGVTVEAGAQFDLTTTGNKKLTAGKVFIAISNTAATPISGTFANLADGSTVSVGVNKLQVSYSGGDGNDLTLTVVQ
jgi:autotransporter-associated beta strand protein